MEQKTTALAELDLHGNNIGEDGCEKLARALRQQKTLLRLNLNGNPLTDKGGVAIAQSLAVRILVLHCICRNVFL
jgi:Ran GTPase-activating protein (RanGAP) involved in mRNA processing and transport